MYQTLLIDDEHLAINRLQRLLEPFSEEIKITGTAVNGLDAVEKIIQLKPDLIFLDIQMPGLNGFEVLQQLDQLPWIIFCTAYDEYALKAFETNAIDYLLKPVEPERLKKSLNKLNKMAGNNNSEFNNHISNLLSQLSPKTLKQITVRDGNKVLFVPVEEIIYFKASHKYVELHTQSDRYLISKTLNDLEEQLKSTFTRTHRSILVQHRFIQEVIKKSDGNHRIRLKDNKKTELPFSRSARKMLEL